MKQKDKFFALILGLVLLGVGLVNIIKNFTTSIILLIIGIGLLLAATGKIKI